MKTIKLLAILFISSLTISSCSKDNDHDDHDHEEELVTTLVYTLTNNADSNDVVTMTFQDLDGEGGNDGTISVSADLKANAIYSGVITLLNETESPAEDITEEVEHEGEEHEFFFTNSAGLSITKDDTDTSGNPVGLETTVTVGNAGSGTLTIVLKHEPTKPNNNTTQGAGGATDIEVTFPITVQ